MKIEQNQITKLLISDLMGEPHRLDPVTVIIEDQGVRAEHGDHKTRQGEIILKCYGSSWTAYWGSMGDRTVAQFFSDCSADYLIGCLARSLSPSRFSGQALVELARKTIISRRQGWRHRNLEFGYLDKEECRELFDQTDELSNADSLARAMDWHIDLLCKIFDTEEPWHFACDATEPNPDYLYLQRIVLAVQAGLIQTGLAQGKVAA